MLTLLDAIDKVCFKSFCETIKCKSLIWPLSIIAQWHLVLGYKEKKFYNWQAEKMSSYLPRDLFLLHSDSFKWQKTQDSLKTEKIETWLKILSTNCIWAICDQQTLLSKSENPSIYTSVSFR